MFKKRTLIVSFGLAALLILTVSTVVNAAPETQGTYLNGFTLSEMEKLCPMSAEAEAAIVHTVPQVPVIIDGVCYKPENIALFNGQRLRFTSDKEGNLYAFTTVEGAEKFLVDKLMQSGLTTTLTQNGGGTRASVVLYENILYGGEAVVITGIVDSLGDFNDKASSFMVGQGIGLGIIYKDENRGGDYYYMEGGNVIPFLWLYGFNDNVSSAQRVG